MKLSTSMSSIGSLAEGVARAGRELQRYEADGTRLIVGVVPVLWQTAEGVIVDRGDGRGAPHFVMVLSTKSEQWIFPKGGWETDETATTGAAREAYEEAGVRGEVLGETVMFEARFKSKRGNSSKMSMYLMEVKEVLKAWPEGDCRERRVVSVEAAIAIVGKEEHRLALLAALQLLEIAIPDSCPDGNGDAGPTHACQGVEENSLKSTPSPSHGKARAWMACLPHVVCVVGGVAVITLLSQRSQRL